MSRRMLTLPIIAVAVLSAAAYLYANFHPSGVRAMRVLSWIRSPSSTDGRIIQLGTRCGEAPFIFPTTGIAGFLWGDSFRLGHRHQGVDIFAGTDVNVTPVVAAYPGLLTRLPEWKSTVIVRVPRDPLSTGSPDLGLLHPHGGRQRQLLYLRGVSARAPTRCPWRPATSWAARATTPAIRTIQSAFTCTSRSSRMKAAASRMNWRSATHTIQRHILGWR